MKIQSAHIMYYIEKKRKKMRFIQSKHVYQNVNSRLIINVQMSNILKSQAHSQQVNIFTTDNCNWEGQLNFSIIYFKCQSRTSAVCGSCMYFVYTPT